MRDFKDKEGALWDKYGTEEPHIAEKASSEERGEQSCAIGTERWSGG